MLFGESRSNPVTFPNVDQQAPSRFLDQVHDPFEAARTAVVRIGHFSFGQIRGKIQEQSNTVPYFRPLAERQQMVEIVPIHRQHIIEFNQIGGRDLPGAQVTQIHPPA